MPFQNTWPSATVDASVSYISDIETGRKTANLKSLIAIADVMDTTVDMLLGRNHNYKTGEFHTDFFAFN